MQHPIIFFLLCCAVAGAAGFVSDTAKPTAMKVGAWMLAFVLVVLMGALLL
jgi:hypothetical protein